MPRLAARWSGRSARCDRPGTGREVLVLKGYDEVAVFLGLDVGKQGHHAVAQDRSGKKLLDRALPNDEAKLRELYGRMKVHGPVLLVVDQPATIGALPCPAVGKSLPTTSVRIRAQVLTPLPCLHPVADDADPRTPNDLHPRHPVTPEQQPPGQCRPVPQMPRREDRHIHLT